MDNYIDPKLDSFEVITSWDEDDRRWGVQIAVNVINNLEKTPRALFATDRHHIGEQFYLIICSPDFLNHPNQEVSKDDLQKALVLNTYSERSTRDYLESKINVIGKVTVTEFEKIFSGIFDMSDWHNQ